MCRVFSVLTQVQSRYRIGCLEKWVSLPPVTCLQEWHETVYAQSRITLQTMTSVPSPIPNPPSAPWNARIASYVLISETTSAT